MEPKIVYKNHKIRLVKLPACHGYIDHHGTLTTAPGVAGWTDERGFQSAQAAIDTAKFEIDLKLKLFSDLLD